MSGIIDRVSDKVDAAELFQIDRRTTPISLRGQGIDGIKTQQISGSALRVIRDGRIGFASTNDLATPEVLIDAVCTSAKYGDPAGFSFASKSPKTAAGLCDPRITEMSLETLAEIADGVHEKVRGALPDAEVETGVAQHVDAISIETSGGLSLSESRAALNISTEAVRAQPDDILIIAKSIALRQPDEASIDALIERIKTTYAWSERLVAAPTGDVPVVFAPSAVVAVLLPVLFGCNGRNVLMGMSPLGERLGDALFDPRFGLVDDGLIAEGMWSGSFDDEGSPSCRTDLVRDGVLTSFLYDRRTAGDAGMPSTGNGRREGAWYQSSDYRTPPAPAFSNLVVSRGDQTTAELIGSIDHGLLVHDVLGLGQGNISSGDFSNTVGLGFLIENGEVVGRVKNVMIAGNSYQLLKDRLLGISSETEWSYGRLQCSALALDGVSVSAKR